MTTDIYVYIYICICVYIYIIILRSFLPRMKNVSDKSCRENQNTFCVQ